MSRKNSCSHPTDCFALCIQLVIMCKERAHLEETTERLRTQLQQPGEAPASSNNVIAFPISSDERAIRTALFSVEIDLAYHRARCVDCRSSADSQALLAA
jgi:hypothetical protein